MSIKNLAKNKDVTFNSMNKDIMLLDTREGPEYDIEQVLKHEDDKRKNKAKDDNIVSSALSPSDYDTHSLSPSDYDTHTLSPSDNTSPSLSFPCLTRESRKHECRIESGRSMVEMLGVLAVMGVLTIGGISGYNYALNKHHANQVLQDIRLIYQEAKYPNTIQQIIANGAFPNMEIDMYSPYEYSFSLPTLSDFIYNSESEAEPHLISVNVSGVSKTACDILLKTKPEYVLMLKVNDTSTWYCTEDDNELNYIFEITADSLEYGKCSVCTGEHCFDDDMNCPEGEYCYNDTCSKCAPGYTENTSGKCMSCSFNRRTDLSQDSCHRCGDTMFGGDPSWGSDTNCYPCSQVNLHSTKKDYCQKCMDVNSDVVWFQDSGKDVGTCVNCKTRFGMRSVTTQEECQKCAKINGSEHFVYYPIKTTDKVGRCYKCDSLSGGQANGDNTACTCSDEKVWVHDMFWQGCVTCGGIGSHEISKFECNKCGNYYFIGTNDRNGSCKPCPEGQTKSADGKSCVDKPTG